VQEAGLIGELVEVVMVGEGIGKVEDVAILILNGVLKVVPRHGALLVVVGIQVAWSSICLQPSMSSVTSNLKLLLPFNLEN
jgi:hypothetical protein